MDSKLKVDKKTGNIKLDKLPAGCTCVMICLVKKEGLVPLRVEPANNIKADEVMAFMDDPDVSQVTFIPIDFNTYIHVFKEWRPYK